LPEKGAVRAAWSFFQFLLVSRMYMLKPEETRPLRILLISPQGKMDDDSNQKPLFHMALGVLVSLTPSQHHIELVDEHFHDTINYDGNYDLVGITARTLETTKAYEIADTFRGHGKKVILGGLHISFNAAEAARPADSIVIGEADNLGTTVLDDVANGSLKPVYDSKDFPPVKEITPLDYAHIAKVSKREKVDGTKSIPLYVTRGCPSTARSVSHRTSRENSTARKSRSR
jgi:bacteriochlorophyll C8 methyltransferase